VGRVAPQRGGVTYQLRAAAGGKKIGEVARTGVCLSTGAGTFPPINVFPDASRPSQVELDIELTILQ